jgi:hypothetical protein
MKRFVPGLSGLLPEGSGRYGVGRGNPTVGPLTLAVPEVLCLLKCLSESLEFLITDADLGSHCQPLQVQKEVCTGT